MTVKIPSSYLEYVRPALDRNFKHDIQGFSLPLAGVRFNIETRWELSFLGSFLNSALPALQAVSAAVLKASQIEVNPDLKPEKATEAVKVARLAILQGPVDELALLCSREIDSRFTAVENFRVEILDATRSPVNESEALEVRAIVRGLSGTGKAKFVEVAIASQRFGVLDALEAGLAPIDEPKTYDAMRIAAVLKMFPVLQNVLSDKESLCIYNQKVCRELYGMAALAVDKAMNTGVTAPGGPEYAMPDICYQSFNKQAPRGKPDSSRYAADNEPMPDRLPDRLPDKTPRPITLPIDPEVRLKVHRQKTFGQPRA